MLRELLIGIAGGTVSGITPGIHVNTLAALLRERGVNDGLTLFAMGLTHTFLDAIPSTFLGVPDDGTALGILPAHRLVLKGKGMEVIRIALWASFLAVLTAVPLFPLYVRIAPLYRPLYGKFAVLLLMALLIATERGMKRLYALLIIAVSGVLGVVTFRLNLNQPFYHIFTGLFGIPVVFEALMGKGNLPEDRDSGGIEMGLRRFAGLSFLGTLLGMAASLVPAFTASQAALIGSFFSRDERSFLTVVFSVNTANFLFSFANFLKTGRARNGIVAVMKPLPNGALRFYALAAVLTGMAILLYGEALAEAFLSVIKWVNYKALNLGVILALVCLSAVFDGSLGLLVLLGATMTGTLAKTLGVKRTNCMGVLMIPVIIG